MTEAEKVRRLAARRMQKASAALQAARTLLADRLYEDSTSRWYYAMFHAVSALLLTKGLLTSKHTGVISLFDLHFIKPRMLPAEMSTWIHDAFKARQEADYSDEPVNPRAAAETTVAHAEDFLGQVRPVLDRLLDELDTSPRSEP